MSYSPYSRPYLADCKRLDRLHKSVEKLDLAVFAMAYGNFEKGKDAANKSLNQVFKLIDALKDNINEVTP